MPLRPYALGQQLAGLSDRRPSLSALCNEWGYNEAEAVQFVIGFHEAKRKQGKQVFVDRSSRNGKSSDVGEAS